MPVVDPHAWEHLQFREANAFVDFLGQHALWHHALDVRVRQLGGVPYPSLPLGDGGSALSLLAPEARDALDEEQSWERLHALQASWHTVHQQAHDGAAGALILAEPPDLESYDLTEGDQFVTWIFIHAQEHIRLRVASGL
jgi:hypothetical protein